MAGGVGAAIATGLGFVGTAATVAAVVINTALYIGLTYASSALARKGLGNGVQPREIIVRSGSQPKVVVYGEAVVAGVLFYMNQKPITGDQNFELWVGIVHACHEVEDITDVYYESDLLEEGTQITWSSDQATVDSGPWHADDATHEACTIYRRLGTSTQTLPSDFLSAFSELTSSHRLRGYPCTIHRFQLFDESEEVFKGNQPANIRPKIKGKKVYDPRLDSTQIIDSTTSPITFGSGAHRTNDATTWEWSDNPVLIACDYLTEYWGYAAVRLDWEWNAGQADKCDTLVNVPPVASPTNTQKRYTCNGAISLGDTHNENLAKILATCLGTRSTVNGKIRITVGDYQTPEHSFDESDIIGKIRVRTSVPREDRYNTVLGTFISADQGYIETDFPEVTDAGFVSRDNGEPITKPIELEMVNDGYLAQRIAFKHLQQSDQQITVEVPLRWSGLRLVPGMRTQLTYSKFSWSSKVFKVESLKIGVNGVPVTAVMREDASSAWDDPAVGDYTTKNAQGVIVPPTSVVPPPTSMVVTSGLEANIVEWVNPDGRESWDYVDVYASPDSAWANASRVGTRIQSGRLVHELDSLETRYYWVRAVRQGVESDREPNSDTSDRTATTAGTIPLPNLVPYGYADMEVVTADDFTLQSGAGFGGLRSVDEALAYLGTQCLKAEVDTGTNSTRLYFHERPGLLLGSEHHNIRIRPNRTYIAIAALRREDTQGGTIAVSPQLRSVQLNATPQYVSGVDTWEQHVWLVDASASSEQQTTLMFLLSPDGTISGSRAVIYIDAVMLFDVTDYPRFQNLVTTGYE